MIRVNERWLEYHKAYNVTIEGLGGYTMDQVECRGEGAEERAGEREGKNELGRGGGRTSLCSVGGS